MLGEFLRKSRMRAGKSQKEVSEYFGFSTAQFISNWERGQSKPPFYLVPKIASLYDIEQKEIYKIMFEFDKMKLQQKYKGKI